MKQNFQIFIAALFTVICISSTLVLFTCSPDSVQKAGADEQGFSQSYVQGQLTLNQRTRQKEISIAEQLELVLETAAPENTAVEFPTYSASLGDFTLKDVKIDAARMTGTGDNVRVIQVATYILEPYLPGIYSIPSMTVTYLATKNSTEPTELVTDELQVTVKSLLGQDAGSAEIKDIKGPLSLPQNVALQILLAVILLLLIILGIAGFFYWQKNPAKRNQLRCNCVQRR